MTTQTGIAGASPDETPAQPQAPAEERDGSRSLTFKTFAFWSVNVTIARQDYATWIEILDDDYQGRRARGILRDAIRTERTAK